MCTQGPSVKPSEIHQRQSQLNAKQNEATACAVHVSKLQRPLGRNAPFDRPARTGANASRTRRPLSPARRTSGGCRTIQSVSTQSVHIQLSPSRRIPAADVSSRGSRVHRAKRAAQGRKGQQGRRPKRPGRLCTIRSAWQSAEGTPKTTADEAVLQSHPIDVWPTAAARWRKKSGKVEESSSASVQQDWQLTALVVHRWLLQASHSDGCHFPAAAEIGTRQNRGAGSTVHNRCTLFAVCT